MIPSVFWTTVFTGGSLVASVQLAVGFFLVFAIALGFRQRTALVAILAVVAVNLLYPGGAQRIMTVVLLPLRVLNVNVAGCQQRAIEEERARHYP